MALGEMNMTDFRTTDDWFYAADMADPNAVQAVRAVFRVIQFEAQTAARQPGGLGMWPAAESLGYKRDHLAWELFSTAYLKELARIVSVCVPNTPQDPFQSWVDQIHERYLGE